MGIFKALAKLDKNFIVQAAPLDDKHKKAVNKLYSPHHDFSDHAMGGGSDKTRTEIPLKAAHIIPPKHIVKALGAAGYTAVNYSKGLVKDKHGRDIKIGKVLNKAGKTKELKDFENDPQRAAQGQHKVVISRHPHDVAGMSTNQGWTSCMNMHNGINRKYLPKDIEHGTHVAYLVHKDDHNLNNPIARIALKPHHSKGGHTILRPESRTYGTSNSNFHKTVTEWANKNFPLRATEYKKNSKLYNDDNKSSYLHVRKIGKEVLDSGKLGKNFKHLDTKDKNKIIQKSANPKLINQFFTKHADELHTATYHKAIAKGVNISPAAHEALKDKMSPVRDLRITEDRKKGKLPAPEPSRDAYSDYTDTDYKKWINQHTNKELKEKSDYHFAEKLKHENLAQNAKQKAIKKYLNKHPGIDHHWSLSNRALQAHPDLEKIYDQHRGESRRHFSKGYAAKPHFTK